MKNKTALFAGLSAFLCFCLLTASGKLVSTWGSSAGMIFLAEIISFALPAALLFFFTGCRKPILEKLALRPLPRGALGFTVKMGVTIAVLSLFCNFLVYQLAGLTGMDIGSTVLDAPVSGMPLIGRLLVIVVASSVAEEFYVRGALFSAQQKLTGTAACIILSGLCFAMLHGSMMNFVGPLLAGMAYAYLTFALGSIWPAVIAHAVNNLYYLFVIWVTNTYAAFGIWNYFAILNGLVLLLFLYLTLRSAEQLLVRGTIPHFQKGAGASDYIQLLKNPGVIAFVAAFVARAILHWI